MYCSSRLETARVFEVRLRRRGLDLLMKSEVVFFQKLTFVLLVLGSRQMLERRTPGRLKSTCIHHSYTIQSFWKPT